MTTPVVVPALGESITEATIAKWFKNVGDFVAVDEAVAELETDKVTVEVFAPISGVISACAFKSGDTVSIGAVIAQIDESGVAPAKAISDVAPVTAVSQPKPVAVSPVVPPAPAKMMAENNLIAT